MFMLIWNQVCWWAYDHVLQVHKPRVQPPLERIVLFQVDRDWIAKSKPKTEHYRNIEPKTKTMTGPNASPEVCPQVGQLLLDPKRPLKERWVSLCDNTPTTTLVNIVDYNTFKNAITWWLSTKVPCFVHFEVYWGSKCYRLDGKGL